MAPSGDATVELGEEWDEVVLDAPDTEFALAGSELAASGGGGGGGMAANADCRLVIKFGGVEVTMPLSFEVVDEEEDA